MIDCFVSFCVDDAPDVHVKLLVEELRTRTKGAVNFLLYFEEYYGDSLNNFMRQKLRASHAVLMLLGPEYKDRVDNTRTGTGAYQEFDTIIARNEDPTKYGKLKMIPVHWAGKDIPDAFPTLLRRMNPFSCSLNEFRAHGITQGHPFIPAQTLINHNETLNKISHQLLTHDEYSNQEAISVRASHLARMLTPTRPGPRGDRCRIEDVLQVKFEHGKYDPAEFKQRFFTKTRFSQRLNERNVGLISGRKGSGKTTLVQIRELEASSEEFFPVIDIAVDGWNLHALIQGKAYRQVHGDFEYADMLEARFFDYAWAGFVALCMCESVRRAMYKHGSSSDELIEDRDVALEFDRIVSAGPDEEKANYADLFLLSVTAVRSFIQKVVDEANATSEDKFKLDIQTRLSITNFLESLLGTNFTRITVPITRLGSKRFLFCLDRFDNEIQQYRKENVGLTETQKMVRAQREIEWLGSLMMFVQRTIRLGKESPEWRAYSLFSAVKFFVVLPYDREIELSSLHRDAVAGERIEEIRWQPKELLTMLRKRIQAIYDISMEDLKKRSGEPPEERFNRCLALACPDLPHEVYVSVGRRNFDIDLFLDVLRHSFFRPRDVIIYYAAILGYYDTMVKRGRKIDIESIREAISHETRTIVDFEFIGELKDSWTNILEVLDCFKGREQIMTARRLEEIIGPVEFVFYERSLRVTKFSEKINFLYELGFLGYKNPRQVGKKNDQEDFNFSFMGRNTPPAFESSQILRLLEFAVHPIFIEKLFLVVNSEAPVLYLNWDRINSLDLI